jgi:hypothetical protein
VLEGLVLDLRQSAQIDFVAILILPGCERSEQQSHGARSGGQPESKQAHDGSPF